MSDPAVSPTVRAASDRLRSAPALFAIATLIWGSTWLAITFQLGVVAVEISVAYRFALAALILSIWCRATGRSLAFSRRDHAFLVAQGVLMFGANYVAIYEAERYLTSGLVAVLFSTIVFTNPIGMRIVYGTRLSRRTLFAAAVGVSGVVLLFLRELLTVQGSTSVALGIALGLAATLLATGGNLIAVRNHHAGLGVLEGTVWGMAWGAATAALIATLTGASWTFDPSPRYVLSLAYLAVFGSIVAFGAYFLLLKKAGIAIASYTSVAIPVIAVLLSTLFEGFAWTWTAVLGVALAATGNFIALRRDA
ncbi:MAG TPA: DMT family transporter [Casimicrobiaceae bacterium]|nr:DMT family transporter [Casimicrobiaceae bacterium]